MSERHPTLEEILPYFYRRHPWHGVPLGADAPAKVTAFVEIVPTDTVKYELDKATGLLKIDRPQKFSNVYPTLYGFLPQTYCGDETGRFCTERTGRPASRATATPSTCASSASATFPTATSWSRRSRSADSA